MQGGVNRGDLHFLSHIYVEDSHDNDSCFEFEVALNNSEKEE